jgi:hypothetical protein
MLEQELAERHRLLTLGEITTSEKRRLKDYQQALSGLAARCR